MTTEDKDLKSQFGKLGMYLIEEAKVKIKDLNQQILFQKAEIKKKYRERETKNSKDLRNKFISDYNNILNTNLSTTILESKEKVLKLKNKIINNFINDLYIELQKRIESKFSEYNDYILESIENIKNRIKDPKDTLLYFNSRDFNFFNNQLKKIESIISKGVQIKEDPKIKIGGFKLEQIQEGISFNYTLDNMIQKNYSIIETKFPSIIADSDIKKLQTEFEEFINYKKKKKEDILVAYDRI